MEQSEIIFDTIIYHKGCPDGVTAAFCFWKKFPNATYLPYDHNMTLIDLTNKVVAILDFSFRYNDMISLIDQAKYVILLDHHKSALEELKIIPLSHKYHCILDMQRSGAQIAYDYIFGSTQNRPWFVDYVADRDLWNNALPDTKEINAGLNELGYFKSISALDTLYTAVQNDKTDILMTGKVVLMLRNNKIKEYMKHITMMKMVVNYSETYNVSMVCCERDLRSDLGNEMCSTILCDFAVIYWYDIATDLWLISMRAKNSSLIDLSVIASKFQIGGGHPKAAGFTIKTNEFIHTFVKPENNTSTTGNNKVVFLSQ